MASAIFHTVPLTNVSETMVNAILNETTVRSSWCHIIFWSDCWVVQFWGQKLALDSGIFISYDVEPFLPNLFSHGPASAYPPSRDRGLYPLNIYYAWLSSDDDDNMHSTAVESANYLTQLANSEGQDISDAALYGNYAIYSTPLSRILGDNVDALTSVKAQYDPNNVMALAGGWKLWWHSISHCRDEHVLINRHSILQDINDGYHSIDNNAIGEVNKVSKQTNPWNTTWHIRRWSSDWSITSPFLVCYPAEVSDP